MPDFMAIHVKQLISIQVNFINILKSVDRLKIQFLFSRATMDLGGKDLLEVCEVESLKHGRAVCGFHS